MRRRELECPNPLLNGWKDAGPDDSAAVRDSLIRELSFAVPDDQALRAVADVAPTGVVEIGAGTGYWARLLHEQGVDVLAFDIAPAPSPLNRWFSGVEPWFHVSQASHEVVESHSIRALLLVWPTRDEDWSADVVDRYSAAGGATLLYVGERPGGRTGDDRFHALLGEYDRCWTCAYGVTTAPCICGVVPRFRRASTVTLPHWPGYHDDLHIYESHDTRAALGPVPQRRPRRLTRRS